jgi:hypothetical protein
MSDSVAKLLADLRKTRSRRRAAKQLVELGRDAVPALLEVLTEKYGQEAEELRSILRQIASRSPEVSPLVTQLQSGNQREQRAAIRALGELGEIGAAALPDLLPFLEKASARMAATGRSRRRYAKGNRLSGDRLAWGGGEAGSRLADRLIQSLRSDLPTTRLGAIRALGLLGPLASAARPHLLACQQEINCEEFDFGDEGNYKRFCYRTARALSQIGVASLRGEQLADAIVDVMHGYEMTTAGGITQYLHDDAVAALSKVGIKGMAAILDYMPNMNSNPYMAIGEVFASFGPKAVPLLLETAGDTRRDREQRSPCIVALGLLAERKQLNQSLLKKVRQTLEGIARADDENDFVQERAVIALDYVSPSGQPRQ